jgi:hypothetical protein
MDKLEAFRKPSTEVFTRLIITKCENVSKVVEKGEEYKAKGKFNELRWDEKAMYDYNKGEKTKYKCNGCCDYNKLKG